MRTRAAGHFHLSHNYADSIAVAGGCAFVQTGVISDCNRDGFRHSRLLKGARPRRTVPFPPDAPRSCPRLGGAGQTALACRLRAWAAGVPLAAPAGHMRLPTGPTVTVGPFRGT